MKKRIVTSLLFGTLWLGTICLNSFHIFWLLVLILSALGLYEFFTISLKGLELVYRPLGIAIGLLPVIGSFSGRPDLVLGSFVLALFLAALLIIRIYGTNKINEFIFLAKICSGLCFVGLTSSHLILLMAETDGMRWLLLLTLITTASDTGAYFTGTYLGRHKLCPAISPGKTVEGFAGGLVSALFVTLLCGPLLFGNINLTELAILSLVLSCLGVAGDMTESIFKRSSLVKDSGSILPGHGGILDRVDSILAAAPALYYVVTSGMV